eukprot:g3546.t1
MRDREDLDREKEELVLREKEALRRENEKQKQREKEEHVVREREEQLKREKEEEMRREKEEVMRREKEEMRREKEEEMRREKEKEGQVRREKEEVMKREKEEQLRKEKEEQVRREKEEVLKREKEEEMKREKEELLRKEKEEMLRREKEEEMKREKEKEELMRREKEKEERREKEKEELRREELLRKEKEEREKKEAERKAKEEAEKEKRELERMVREKLEKEEEERKEKEAKREEEQRLAKEKQEKQEKEAAAALEGEKGVTSSFAETREEEEDDEEIGDTVFELGELDTVVTDSGQARPRSATKQYAEALFNKPVTTYQPQEVPQAMWAKLQAANTHDTGGNSPTNKISLTMPRTGGAAVGRRRRPIVIPTPVTPMPHTAMSPVPVDDDVVTEKAFAESGTDVTNRETDKVEGEKDNVLEDTATPLANIPRASQNALLLARRRERKPPPPVAAKLTSPPAEEGQSDISPNSPWGSISPSTPQTVPKHMQEQLAALAGGPRARRQAAVKVPVEAQKTDEDEDLRNFAETADASDEEQHEDGSPGRNRNISITVDVSLANRPSIGIPDKTIIATNEHSPVSPPPNKLETDDVPANQAKTKWLSSESDAVHDEEQRRFSISGKDGSDTGDDEVAASNKGMRWPTTPSGRLGQYLRKRKQSLSQTDSPTDNGHKSETVSSVSTGSVTLDSSISSSLTVA